MVETMQNMEHVYAKWENRNPWSRSSGPTVAPTASSLGGVGSSGSSAKPKQEALDSILKSGRRHWNDKFSTAGLPPPARPQYRRRNHGNADHAALSLSTVNSASLASFKTAPSIVTLAGRIRPYMGRCCNCMATSRAEFYDSSVSSAGLHNVFSIDTARKDNSILTRLFAQSVHAWRRRINHRYPDVSLAVLTSPRVNQAIQQTVQETTEGAGAEGVQQQVKQVLRAEQRRARSVMKRMRAIISNRLVRLTGWFLHHFFGRLLSSVIVHQGQLKLLKHATEKDVPLIMMPTHRSHLDYILVTWILYNMDIRAPHVAAGDNLLIPLFGHLMRGLGGYFIRRKIDKYGKKDHIYRAVLHTYMQELLREGESFEVFIEGGRTRSGKALVPKGGILSVIVDAYNEDIIPDAMLVPISISYDRMLDGEFNNEQMGKPKIHETFLRACVSIWKVLSGHYGSVRIDFCQPFSLKEYLQVANGFPLPPSPNPAPAPAPKVPQGDGDSMVKVQHRGSNHSLYGTDCVVEDMRQTIQGLAEHVVYTQCQAQSVMASHILAFALLYHHSQQGVSVAALRQTFGWLRQEVTSHGRDVGFTGSSTAAILHACQLHSHLLHIQPSSSAVAAKRGENPLEEDDTIIRPVTTLPEVFSLTYYANVLTPLFAVESVIANAIHVSVRADQWLSSSSSSGEDREDREDNKVIVSRDAVMGKAFELCHLLKHEFVFTPSCTELRDVLSDGVDRLLASDVVLTSAEVRRVYDDTRDRQWAEALSRSLACDDDDDDDDEDDEENWTMDQMYLVNRESAESMEKYHFLRGVIAPILETYFILACNLPTLEDNPMPVLEFTKKVHQHLITRVQTGVSQCGASAALDTVRNGIHALQYLNVLDSYTAADSSTTTMVALNRRYTKEKLTEFIASLEAYRS